MSNELTIGTISFDEKFAILNNEIIINDKTKLLSFEKGNELTEKMISKIDVLIVAGNNLEESEIEFFKKQIKNEEICLILLGGCDKFPEAKYCLEYDNDIERKNANDIINFIIHTTASFKKQSLIDNIEREQRLFSRKNEIIKKSSSKDVFKIMETLINFIGSKDHYTKDHCKRVAKLSYLLAEELHLTDEEKMRIYQAALIHDVGKIGVPDSIITKEGKLTNEEFEKVKKHSVFAEDLLPNKFFDKIKPIIRSHHERYDGKGYPDNLQAEEIPLEARIIAVVDSFDAMTTKRSYNQPKNFENAVVELVNCSGTQFDPKVTKAFITLLKSLSMKEAKVLKKAM